MFTKEALPGGPNTDAPTHEPVAADGEIANTVAPQVGIEEEADADA